MVSCHTKESLPVLFATVKTLFALLLFVVVNDIKRLSVGKIVDRSDGAGHVGTAIVSGRASLSRTGNDWVQGPRCLRL